MHGLRALGVVAIVQFHCVYVLRAMAQQRGADLASGNPIVRFASNGWIAMDLFFILSGFLIGHILFHNFEKRSDGFSGIRRFWYRRAFRTFPLYYVVLVGLALTKGVAPGLNELFYLSNYPFSSDYVMPWSWSLSVEEHFYLLGPLVIWAVLRIESHSRQLAALAALWFAGFAIRFATFLSEPSAALYFPTHCRIDILTAGVMIALISTRYEDRLRQLFRSAHVGRASLAIPGVIFLAFMLNKADLSALGIAGSMDFGVWAVFGVGTLTSIGFSCLILRLVYRDDGFSRVLGHRAFRACATLGYGVYLVHVPIAERVCAWVAPLFPELSFVGPWALSLSLSVVISGGVAYVLHLVVEKPFLAARDRLIPARQ